MPQTRQLAAIMFTDIVGYTALMGEDEHKAFEILDKNRRLQKPLIEQYGGKWIKELGDGVMASFTTVSDAVNAAIKIQEACNVSKEFLLRIGIHHGEVVFEDDDIFGDAVNIASRLQALAPVGAIWISESVQNNVSNKKDIKTKFVRAETLKNVKEPVRIYEVITNDTEKEQPKTSAAEISTRKTIPEKSIAVLPFVNMSNDPEQEYFSDGMSEDIITSLSHLEDLKVAGRTSSFQFKGRNIDLHEVGEKLGVKTVLEGSVRKQGNRLRITAQLINVEDGFHLWSQKYDRDMDDIFAIQDEIALTITERLKLILLEKDREKITKTATDNAEAYELYLKGMFHLTRRGSSIKVGMECFKKAIEIDPGYSLAYTGFAYANILGAFYSFFSGSEVMKKVKEALETSIRLDSSHCETYFILAQYYVTFEWNWQEAEKNYLKSIDINKNFAQPRSLYGMAYLGFVHGRFDEAERQGRIAIKLEPLSAIDHADLAWTLYVASKFQESLAMAKTGMDLDNNSFLSHRIAGLAYMGLTRYEEAIETFRYLMKISDRNQHAINSLIWAYCNNGNLEEANELMNELIERSSTEYIAGTHAGISAAYLGDLERAISFLEKAYLDHDPMLITLKSSPHIPLLLTRDSRFPELLKKIGFPD